MPKFNPVPRCKFRAFWASKQSADDAFCLSSLSTYTNVGKQVTDAIMCCIFAKCVVRNVSIGWGSQVDTCVDLSRRFHYKCIKRE